MNSIGIDLGKHGGLVLLASDGALLGWARTPLIGKHYDGHAMAYKLRCLLDWVPEGEETRAFVEAPAVFGLMNSQAAAVGEGVGRWMQALEMSSVSYQLVPAQTWVPVFAPTQKRRPGQPKESPQAKQARLVRNRKARKEKLVLEAMRRFPGIPWSTLNKVAASGVADAALLAEWGRGQWRKHKESTP
jgi:hypothetical protein